MKIKITPKTLLLAGLVSTVPIKIVKTQPIKFTDCVVDTVTFAKKPMKNILVADNFMHKNIDINGDFLCDVSHGFVTSSLIEKGLPEAKVVKCNIFPKSGVNQVVVAQRLNNLFSTILKKIDEGKKFDAINLSLGFSVEYKFLSEKIGVKLNPENIAEYAKKVRKALANANEDFVIQNLSIKEIANILDKMDKITDKGTKIYLAAGNSCDENFNLLMLANNIENVGAVDRKGHFVVYSDRNSLVNRFENGDVCSKVVKGGFDITGDGKLDVKKEETTAFFNFVSPFAIIEGTSFASPRAIVKDFSKK